VDDEDVGGGGGGPRGGSFGGVGDWTGIGLSVNCRVEAPPSTR